MEKLTQLLQNFDQFSHAVGELVSQAVMYFFAALGLRFFVILFVGAVLIFDTDGEFSAFEILALVCAVFMGVLLIVFYSLTGMVSAMFLAGGKVQGYLETRRATLAVVGLEIIAVVYSFWQADVFRSPVGVFIFCIFIASILFAFQAAQIAGHIRFNCKESVALVMAKHYKALVKEQGEAETMRLQQTQKVMLAEGGLQQLPEYKAVKLRGEWVKRDQFNSRISSCTNRLKRALNMRDEEQAYKEIAYLREMIEIADAEKWPISTYKKHLDYAEKELPKLSKVL